MRSTLNALMVLVALFLLAGSRQLPQATPGPGQPPSAPTKTAGSIEGAVLAQDGGRPVRKATVTLFLEGSGMGEGRKEAETDNDGHFAFKDLAAGRYRLSVQHPNFVAAKGLANAQLSLVALSDGQQIKDILFRLIPAAVIRGRIIDEDGDPMPRVAVQALQQRYFRGRRQMFPAGSANTDDMGEFRIHSLSPGRYYIAASRLTMLTSGSSDNKTNVRQYVRTYYPSSIDMPNASAVQVRSGDELPLNFSLVKMETAVVHGTVFGPNGEKASTGTVYLSPAGEFSPYGQAPSFMRDGTFEARVLPGRYRATAMIAESGQSMSTVSALIVVPREGLEGVKLQSAATAKVTARVRVEGNTDANYENMRVSLLPRPDDEGDTGFPMFGSAGGKANKDGVVEMERVSPGTYDVMWFPQSPGFQDYYLKSVRLGTRDVTESGLRVISDSLQFQMVISPAAPRVEGSVLDSDQHSVKGAFIVAVPEGERRKRDQAYHTTVTDQSGHFLMRGLAPGRYTLLALEDPEPGSWADPDFLKTVEDKGANVSLSESDNKQLQLHLIQTSAPTAAAAQ